MKRWMKEFFLLQRKREEVMNTKRGLERDRELRVIDYQIDLLLFKCSNEWRAEVEALSEEERERRSQAWEKELTELAMNNAWLVYEYYKVKGLLSTKEARIAREVVEECEWRFNELRTKIEWVRLLKKYGEDYMSFEKEKEEVKLREREGIINLERNLSLRDLELRELALKTLRACNKREDMMTYVRRFHPNLKGYVKSCERRANRSLKRLLRVVNGDVLRIKRVLTQEEWVHPKWGVDRVHPKKGLITYINEYLENGRVKFYDRIVYV